MYLQDKGDTLLDNVGTLDCINYIHNAEEVSFNIGCVYSLEGIKGTI